jgi:hypothetical protein
MTDSWVLVEWLGEEALAVRILQGCIDILSDVSFAADG